MIAERIAAVRARIDAAAVAAGRDPSEVHLVAVSKTVPEERVREALLAGQVDFGENYAQELRDKVHGVGDGARWHFIGRFQRNKAKYLTPCHRIHALESLDQAHALAARADRPIPVLVAVNEAGEASKGGVRPDAVGPLLDALASVPNVRAVGLMCLPPADDDPEASAPWFASLRDLAARHRARGHEALAELSMGMSHDFEVAVREGATWVRVGTAIFGVRS